MGLVGLRLLPVLPLLLWCLLLLNELSLAALRGGRDRISLAIIVLANRSRRRAILVLPRVSPARVQVCEVEDLIYLPIVED